MTHVSLSLTINGRAFTGDVEPRTLLLDFLREEMRLTGAHRGCDTSQCGACVVHVDGKTIKSCSVLAVECDGADIVTIEGIAGPSGILHPMQEAFAGCHGLQCGFCTPGMIMTAIAIATDGEARDAKLLREELHGNLCRCTGYQNIIAAVIAGTDAMNGHGGE